MSQNEFLKFFDPEMAKKMPGFTQFPFDTEQFLETQKKNLQALGEAQQQALKGLQDVTKKQAELFSQLTQDNAEIAQEIMGESSPEQKVAKQTELMKKNYERSIANLKEIGEVLNKSNQGATDIINKRISASLSEVKKALEASGKDTAKKAA